MNIFGQIEKLINEHGSATILKERLALASDQYSILEQKNSVLEIENQNLKAEVENAENKEKRLNLTINNLNKTQKQTTLDDATVNILNYFFDTQRDLLHEEVTAHAGLDLSIVSYHFDILQEKEFIVQTTLADSGLSWLDARGGGSSYKPATFGITAAGRKHVVEAIRA